MCSVNDDSVLVEVGEMQSHMKPLKTLNLAR